tara:strand:+ start:1124 stop:2608 length:1485 start_codon:yes stop_codon:yes gene_type:complete
VNKQFITIKLFILLSIFGCSGSEETSDTQEESIPSFVEHPAGFLIGNDIKVWENQTESTPENKLLLALNNNTNINVIVLGTKDNENPINESPLFTKVRFSFNNVNYEGWVEPKFLFSDPKGLILYGVSNNRDDRIQIDPPYYSVSNLINPKQYKGQKPSPWPKTDLSYKELQPNLSHCQIFDSALLLYSAENLARGEFETQEEFKSRVELIKKVANSTNWNKKIYVSAVSVMGSSSSYNIEDQKLTFTLMQHSYSKESINTNYGDGEWHNDSEEGYGEKLKMNYIEFDANKEGSCGFDFDQGASNLDGRYEKGEHDFRVDPDKRSYGDFKILFMQDKYSGSGFDDVKLKLVLDLDRNRAKDLKESAEPLILIYGFNPSEVKYAQQWESCRDTGYGKSCDGRGGFAFSATLEYIFLMMKDGQILSSYFSNNYKSNYLKNDLYIQENLLQNKDLAIKTADLTDEERLAKFYASAICYDREYNGEIVLGRKGTCKDN